MSLQSYKLQFTLVYNIQGTLKTNIIIADGFVINTIQAEFQQFTYEQINTLLDVVDTIIRTANKFAILSYELERLNNKDYHCKVQYFDGDFDAIVDSVGLVSVSAIYPPKEIEERRERFKIVRELIGIMERTELVKVNVVRI